MVDLHRILERRSANVVTLSLLLQGTNRIFQKTMKELLIFHGFDVDETLPNIQLAEQILDSIQTFNASVFEADLGLIRARLIAVGSAGVMVDLSLFALETTLIDFP